MAKRFGLWVAAGAMSLTAACAGDPFVLADASASVPPPDSGPAHEASVSDAPVSADGRAFSTTFSCANQSCTVPQMCCTSVGSPTGSNCTQGSCAPCSTELDCASDSNCTGSQACCIAPSTATAAATCNPTAFVARCSGTVCANGASRLCDPNGPLPRCPLGRTCSTDSGDLQNVGLPPGFGVCK